MNVWLLDTNVILRYLLRDNEPMYQAAVSTFEQAQNGDLALYADPMVIAECALVLKGPVYRRNRVEISQALLGVSMLDGVSSDDGSRLAQALSLFAQSNLDFTDAYLAAKASNSDWGIVSFDKDFHRLGVLVYVPMTPQA